MKVLAAGLIKLVMLVVLLTGLIGVPYLVISYAWDWFSGIWHEHPVWTLLLLVPVGWLALEVCKVGIRLVAKVMVSLGSAVDRLES